MFDDKNRFVIEDYNKKKPFSSFLPGIAGEKGIPIWSFYVNRGQGICSFGTEDKQNPIMEFFPAHTSYQIVKRMGFRTFIKVDGCFYEPFSSDDYVSIMYVGNNELELSETNEKLGLKVNVLYYVLPNEKIGALTRQVTVTNLSGGTKDVEIIDGMPALIPYGVTLRDMKEVTQTIKAWMQVEHVEEKLPFYRLRASSADTTHVSEIAAGNFYIAFDQAGNLLPVIVDAESLFLYDTEYSKPVHFLQSSLEELIQVSQVTSIQVPSGFGCAKGAIDAGQEMRINSLVGHISDYHVLQEFVKEGLSNQYFDEKCEQARVLVGKITDKILTHTANNMFDEYCKQTYIDNLLRGGYPIKLADDKVFYVYSRKHGDLERDYNSFSMLSEYYSQGMGNYRDVNQNRRSDLIFSPFVKDHNIKKFYSLIQLDGYNPLILLQTSYMLEDFSKIKNLISPNRVEEFREFFKEPFTPGKLMLRLQEEEEPLFDAVIQNSKENTEVDFNEGYWTDHWTYNLDLVESYLNVYAENEEKLLYDDADYPYYEARAVVLPRKLRYVVTENGLRQFYSIDTQAKQNVSHTWARTEYGKGEIYKSNLMAKMVLLSALKFAALDIKGKGIEMEGGKPGWYDALNGLPALMGSSMCETYELKRQLLFLIATLKKFRHPVAVPVELSELISVEKDALSRYYNGKCSRMDVWNQVNVAKEHYREITRFGIEGRIVELTAPDLLQIFSEWIDYIDEGIMSALKENNGMAPAYCAYHMDDFQENNGIITFTGVEEIVLPNFLEGPVRYMKLLLSSEEKKEIYNKIKESELYDTKLRMYKINAPLESASYEIGRARAFCRGWLENESIWLHMEYKYLLELLKSGMYQEYFEDLKTTCIPFMDYETYGRSLTENSSFIASSANPNENVHGRGFVARLSGSTAEFLQMWHLMFFGNSFIKEQEDRLICEFAPALPEYLIPADGIVRARLFGVTDIVYRIEGKGDLIPGQYDIEGYYVRFKDGRESGKVQLLDENIVYALKNSEITEILVDILNREAF